MTMNSKKRETAKAKREGDVAIDAICLAIKLTKRDQEDQGGYGHEDELVGLDRALNAVRTALRTHRARETRARKAVKR